MRGRLINPFLVSLYRLDSTATNNDPDGAGALASGYDPDFREPRKLPQESSAVGVDARIEMSPLLLLAQVEVMSMARMRQMWGGNAPQTAVCCVFHFRDLEQNDLVDEQSGNALIYATTRLGEIMHHSDETRVIKKFPEKPGLFADRVEDEFGGLGRERNLYKVYFTDRVQGAT